MSDGISDLVRSWSRRSLAELDQANAATGKTDRELAMERARILRQCASDLAAAITTTPTTQVRRPTP